MARQFEDCTPLIGECVRVLFRNFCIGEGGLTDDPNTWPTLSGSVKLGNIPAGTRLCDPNGAEYLQISNTGVVGTIQNFEHSGNSADPESTSWEICEIDGCEYLSVRTCSLPATRDSDHDPDDPNSPLRSLDPQGATYLLNLSVAGIGLPEVAFEIDAAIDYSAEYVCDCILLKNLATDGTAPVALSDVFSDRVCNTACIEELKADVAAGDAALLQAIADAAAAQAQVDADQQVLIDANTACCADHETRIQTLEGDLAALVYVTEVIVGPPDADGNVEITYVTNTGVTTSAGVVPEPADLYLQSVVPSDVTNADGSVTTTYTYTWSDGSTATVDYTHLPSDIPTALTIDPATGEVCQTYTRPDGTTYQLCDTIPPVVDTNTTNVSITYDPATGEIVITDSDGNTVDTTIPPTPDVGEAVVTDNGAANTITTTAVDTAGNTTTGTAIARLNKNTGSLGTSGPLDPATDVVLTDGNVSADAVYSAANDDECAPDDGLPIGKASDGTLRQQPPLRCPRDSQAVALTQLVGPAITAVVGTTIVSLCATITNDSCWRLELDGQVRTNIGMKLARNLRQDWLILANTSTGPTHTAQGSWAGNPVVRREQCATANCDTDDRRQLVELFTGRANPGQVAEICVDLEFNPVTYVESPFNQLAVGSNFIKLTSQACQ